MNTRMKKLLIYGYGYTASHLVEFLDPKNYLIIGSSREEKKINSINKNIKYGRCIESTVK